LSHSRHNWEERGKERKCGGRGGEKKERKDYGNYGERRQKYRDIKEG
jgi:hypothetical protein